MSYLSQCYLLGHRGARAEYLENSAIGFAHAQHLQVNGKQLDGIEFDIQMTTDGQFVVVHDETLERLVGEQSWVMDKTLNQLTQYRQSDFSRYQPNFEQGFISQPILTLEQLYPYLTGYRHIELEIKIHIRTHPIVLVQNLLRLLSNPDWQILPITLTSFDTDILLQLQLQQASLPMRYPTGLLLEPKTTLPSQIRFLPMPNKDGEALMYRTFNQACELGCGQVGVYYALITPTLVEIAKRFGLKVTAWTVNDIDAAKKLLNMGVDCIITDFPTKFLKNLTQSKAYV